MRIRYARLTTPGPVRPVNEDWLDFWEAKDPLLRERQGSLALLADGVGGSDDGARASRLAVEEALRIFREQPPAAPPAERLRQMFAGACARVYDAGLSEGAGRTLATTLVAALVRGDTATIAHVGDSRAYLVRGAAIRRLTADHAATALPVKLGLMLERQAMASPGRSRLTRCLGAAALCAPAFATAELRHGDFLLLCTDGLYAFVLDEELRQIVTANHPYDACKKLAALAERRGADDNLSLQLLEVRDFEKLARMSAPPTAKSSAPGPGEPAPGQVLDRRFELTDLVARSNMASIFRATDRETGAVVAVKLPLLSLESDVAGYERFRREEEIGARLDHPAILRIVRVDPAKKSRPYLVMEFLEGETLAEHLARGKPLPEPEAARIASRICDALDYLHRQGIVHRDLKPQNIMLCRDGSLRLMDFGIARTAQARRLTFVGLSPVMGTPDYMAPEQVKGKRGDQRSDLYSLGAILYEMAAGATPFEGESPYVVMNARVTGDPPVPRKLNPRLTPVLEEIILHALERDPAQRYASAADMKRELDDYEQVSLTNRWQRLRAPQPWKSGRRLALLITGLVALQILLFLGMWWYFKSAGR